MPHGQIRRRSIDYSTPNSCPSINGLFVQSLRLPREMRSLFLWGYAQKLILGILNHMPACPDRFCVGVVIFFRMP